MLRYMSSVVRRFAPASGTGSGKRGDFRSLSVSRSCGIRRVSVRFGVAVVSFPIVAYPVPADAAFIRIKYNLYKSICQIRPPVSCRWLPEKVCRAETEYPLENRCLRMDEDRAVRAVFSGKGAGEMFTSKQETHFSRRGAVAFPGGMLLLSAPPTVSGSFGMSLARVG